MPKGWSIMRGVWATLAVGLSSSWLCADDMKRPGPAKEDVWMAPNSKHAPPKLGEPPLFLAARMGDHDTIRRLLQQGADINDVFDIGLDPGAMPQPATALMVAAGSGDGASVETVKLLLELGARAETVLSCWSAADFAIRGLGWNYRPGGDTERLQVLLKAGAPLNLEDSRVTAEAASKGDVELLRAVLDAGGKPDAVWDEKAHEARQKEFEASIPSEMLEMLEGHVGRGPYESAIPLFQAARSGCVRCVELLLARGADPLVISDSGATALFVAANAATAQLLLDAGVDPLAVNSWGRDAMGGQLEQMSEDSRESAAAREEVVRLLGSKGVPLDRAPKASESRLYHAAFGHLASGVECLLRLDSTLKGDAKRLDAALFAICWQGEYEEQETNEACQRIVQSLVGAGADVNARDEDGWSPLHQAAGGDWGNVTAVRALLKHGAKVDVPTPDGTTALMIAAAQGEVEVVSALLEAGADPSRKDRDRMSAVDYARTHLSAMREMATNPVDMEELGIGIDQEEMARISRESLDEAVRTMQLLKKAADARKE